MNAARHFETRLDDPLTFAIDPDARIASVPATMTTKGMYLDDLVVRLPPAVQEAAWARVRVRPGHGRYQAFLDYPFADALVWLLAVAGAEHAGVPLAEGLRRLGRRTVEVFLESKAGRVVRAMRYDSPRDSLLVLPDMWRRTDPGATTSARALAEREVEVQVQGFPGWLDCGVIGTLEALVVAHGESPRIDVTLRSDRDGTFQVSW